MSFSKAGGPLSSDFILGVYVPSIVVLSGVFLARRDFLPIAIAVVVGLAGYKLYEARIHPVLKPKEYQKFPLEQKTVLSHNTAIYRFKLPGSGAILGLPIGQHISVKTNVAGEDVMRSYTPISSDDDLGHFDLLIKSYPTGRLSKHFGEMKIGDTLDFAGPKGAMIYTPNMKRHIGMIAGGTGITPMWQIITAILKGRPEKGGTDVTEIDLLFANVNEADILMKKELDALAAQDKRFRVHYVLNNPPEGWKGETGFVSADMMKANFPPPANDTKVLLCGPPPMVKAMKGALETLGYEKAGAYSKLRDQVFAF